MELHCAACTTAGLSTIVNGEPGVVRPLIDLHYRDEHGIVTGQPPHCVCGRGLLNPDDECEWCTKRMEGLAASSVQVRQTREGVRLELRRVLAEGEAPNLWVVLREMLQEVKGFVDPGSMRWGRRKFTWM